MYLAGLHKGGLVVPVKMKLWLLIYLLLLQIKFCLISRKVTAVSSHASFQNLIFNTKGKWQKFVLQRLAFF